ncbi:MAG: hypothetical protein HRF50_04960 [Phycisphaerae bacterium]|jgi:uncharacterized membrane protein YphA (DoxX/SURF4 family)
MTTSDGKWRTAALVARLIVGAVFLAAAYGKIADPAGFAAGVAAYRAVPTAMTNAIAFTLPWFEGFCALLLMLGLWRFEVRLSLLLLLVGFTGLKLYEEVAGLRIDCSCFSGPFAFLSKIFSGWRGIALNLVLIAALLLDWYAHRFAPRIPRISVEGAPAPA